MLSRCSLQLHFFTVTVYMYFRKKGVLVFMLSVWIMLFPSRKQSPAVA